MKILHAADFHLDAPFAALSPEKAAIRRGEGREIPLRLAELAREEQVDLVLLAGDLFDGPTVRRETLSVLKEALGGIPAPVFIAPGNHDYYASNTPYEGAWPENVTIFRTGTLVPHPLPRLGCVVYGAAFTGNSCLTDPLAGFSVPRDGNIHIAVLHGDVGQPCSRYAPISEEHLAASGLTYCGLGHIHAPSGLRQAGETFWAYPGCPEGHGFDETGERGCLIVETGERTTARFCTLAARSYVDISVEAGEDPLAAGRQALAGQEEHCVRLTFTGETTRTLAGVEEKLASLVFSLRVKDATRPKTDREALRAGDTLTAAFFRVMEEKLEKGEPGAELALRFGLAALERGEDCRP